MLEVAAVPGSADVDGDREEVILPVDVPIVTDVLDCPREDFSVPTLDCALLVAWLEVPGPVGRLSETEELILLEDVVTCPEIFGLLGSVDVGVGPKIVELDCPEDPVG